MAALFLCLPLSISLIAAEGARTFPLWDGKETVESYAARVNLPATKSIDLGGGVKLDLVLIPAGQFIMGSAEPEKPKITAAGANWLIGLGGGAASVLLLMLLIKWFRKRKLSFSLRWLLLLTIAAGVCVGGIARRSVAVKEQAQYDVEMSLYVSLPVEEMPAHPVTLTQPFYMGKYTVTQEQYSAVTGSKASFFKGAQHPVERVSWNDATQFCTKLNGLIKDKNFRAQLPTEAQWEYACRAGTRTLFYSGNADSDLDAVGWYAGNSGNMTHPVGQKKTNAFGLYDMHGNTWQWCADGYDPNYYVLSPLRDPPGVRASSSRVVRGGGYPHEAKYCRSAIRAGVPPDFAEANVSFRIVLSLDH